MNRTCKQRVHRLCLDMPPRGWHAVPFDCSKRAYSHEMMSGIRNHRSMVVAFDMGIGPWGGRGLLFPSTASWPLISRSLRCAEFGFRFGRQLCCQRTVTGNTGRLQEGSRSHWFYWEKRRSGGEMQRLAGRVVTGRRNPCDAQAEELQRFRPVSPPSPPL